MEYREAISILKTWMVTGDKEHEALDMAISALQAQADGDTISRQAAIDAAIKADMENNSNVLSEKRARVIDRHISAVPSAQPLVIHCTDCEGWHERQSILGFAISQLPSAQPEPLVNESRPLVNDLVKEPCEDAVSRHAELLPELWKHDDRRKH